jgi:xanthine dehydrogenase small subunit
MIRFLLDGTVVEVEAEATETTLELIRTRLGRKGTKEGCGEGDCGACTVLLGEAVAGAVQWRAVNACILFAPMLDGKALATVESLGGHSPVQTEMVARHGSQCGFCTPGFIMSLEGRARGGLGTVGRPVADVLSGNLCRCTGYGPIVASGEAVPPAPRDDSATLAALESLRPGGSGPGWFAPRSADALAALLIEHPTARIVAGATDVGLWVTKQMRALGTVIFIGDVADLREITETAEGVTLGAGVRYSEGWDALARLHPDLGELIRRIAGTPVRNAGTIGGNIANGSPIGDTPPALIALSARLTLRRGADRRTIPLEDYFIAYGKQDRAEGEFVESIFIPRPGPEAIIAITKLSKRFDSDISAVCGAFNLSVRDGVIQSARIAFGGMAGTPHRATATEAALTGQPFTQATIEAAIPALAQDYQPLTDVRGTSAYRQTVAANLLRRLWLAQSGELVSVLEVTHG